MVKLHSNNAYGSAGHSQAVYMLNVNHTIEPRPQKNLQDCKEKCLIQSMLAACDQESDWLQLRSGLRHASGGLSTQNRRI